MTCICEPFLVRIVRGQGPRIFAMSTRETLRIQPQANRLQAPLPQRKLTTEALLAGAREVILEHRGEQYRLRVTSNGKLLLTK